MDILFTDLYFLVKSIIFRRYIFKYFLTIEFMLWSRKKAFTLVELLVVIVIIWILAAIWFINYSWYTSSAKDTSRIKDLKTISDALELKLSKWEDLPEPDPFKNEFGGWWFITQSYDGIDFKEGLFGAKKRLEFKGDLASLPLDPSWVEYKYAVSKDGRYYVITTKLESWEEYKQSNFMDSAWLLALSKKNSSGNNQNWWWSNWQSWGNWQNQGWGSSQNWWSPSNPWSQAQWLDDTPPIFSVPDGHVINVTFWVTPKFSEITAIDDRPWKVAIDYTPKTINVNKTWDYPVKYTATDPAGNSASITVIYRVWRKYTEPYFIDSSWNRLSSWMKKELNKWQAPNHWDIKAKDEIDWELQVTILSNNINVNVPWTYVITYIARNSWWQESTLNVQYIVKWPSWAWSSISITEWENLNYVELWNKIVVTWFKPWKETENLIIPEMIKWKKVTDINANAFKWLNKIKIIIAPSIEKVWSNAFQGNVIQSIDMWSLKTVGNNAFSNNQLTSITLPNVTTIWEYAFQSNQLTSITLPNVTTVWYKAFYSSKLTSITLPNATTIWDYVFSNNKLTSITLPNVTTVWYNAFSDNQLTSITLPNVTTVGDKAFYNNKLTSITLPNVTTIWDYVFYNNKLTSITLPNVTTVWYNAFSNNQLTSITLPNVTTVGNDAFQNNRFTEVTLPEKLKELWYSAFAWNWVIKVENKSKLSEEQIKWAFNWNNVLEYNWQCRNSWCN